MALEDLKTEITQEIKSDRRVWHFTVIPQLGFITIFILGVGIVTAYGLAIAIQGLKVDSDPTNTLNLLKFFVTGSSSFLGFIVFKLLKILWDTGKNYNLELRAFTNQLNAVGAARDENHLIEIIDNFQKRISH